MSDDADYLTGQLLIAMPTMGDPRFARTVIYMVAHSTDGAMGFVINKPMTSISYTELLEQLEIEVSEDRASEVGPVHYGGPVESGRGFVLHSTEFEREGTSPIDDLVSLTSTVDVLRAIAEGSGPRRYITALGYAGWGAGQLDQEIQRNDWLHVEADEALLFEYDLAAKWERALAKIGIRPEMLSGAAGHA